MEVVISDFELNKLIAIARYERELELERKQ